MCISCRCTRIFYCLGNLSYIFERLASCCAMTAVVSCIVTTLIFMLGVGVGLGYNYCYVDFTSGHRASADAFDTYEDLMVLPANDTEKSDRSNKGSRRLLPIDLPIKKNMKITVPLNEGIDFIELFDKIRSSRQNVTLQLIV